MPPSLWPYHMPIPWNIVRNQQKWVKVEKFWPIDYHRVENKKHLVQKFILKFGNIWISYECMNVCICICIVQTNKQSVPDNNCILIWLQAHDDVIINTTSMLLVHFAYNNMMFCCLFWLHFKIMLPNHIHTKSCTTTMRMGLCHGANNFDRYRQHWSCILKMYQILTIIIWTRKIIHHIIKCLPENR